MKSLTNWILIVISTSTMFGAESSTISLERVPFRLHRGYMILVEGSIGTLDNLTFLIDTGATSSLLNANLARRLKIEGRDKTAVAYGKNLKVQSAILREFYVGDNRFRSVPVLVADFSLLPVIGNHIDAILGMNALIRSNFAIDYESRMVIFNPTDSLDSSTHLDTPELNLVIQLQVHGKPLRLLVDTGAKDLILFRSRLKDGQCGEPTLKKKRIYHLGSSEELRMVQLSQVRFGETELGTLRAYRLDARIKGYPELHGIVGVSSLGLDRIQFDFDNQLVSWAR